MKTRPNLTKTDNGICVAVNGILVAVNGICVANNGICVAVPFLKCLNLLRYGV